MIVGVLTPHEAWGGASASASMFSYGATGM